MVVSDRKFGQQLYGYTANTSGTGTHTYNTLANEYVYVATGGNFDQTSNTNETSYDVYLPEVLSFSDYYPFLMKMPGRNNNSAGYRYQGQGQEEDNEFTEGFLSFEYRVHDPRIGRFLSVDPLRQDYAYNSTYAFSENRVIDGVDLEGLEHVYYTETEVCDCGTTGIKVVSTYDINFDDFFGVHGPFYGEIWTVRRTESYTETKKFKSQEKYLENHQSEWYEKITHQGHWQAFYYGVLADGTLESHYDGANAGSTSADEHRTFGKIMQVSGKMMKYTGMLASGLGFPEFGGPLIKAGEFIDRTGTAVVASVDIYEGKWAEGGLEILKLGLDYMGDKSIDQIDKLKGFEPKKDSQGNIVKVNPAGEQSKALLRLWKDGIDVTLEKGIEKIENKKND